MALVKGSCNDQTTAEMYALARGLHASPLRSKILRHCLNRTRLVGHQIFSISEPLPAWSLSTGGRESLPPRLGAGTDGPSQGRVDGLHLQTGGSLAQSHQVQRCWYRRKRRIGVPDTVDRGIHDLLRTFRRAWLTFRRGA